MRFSASSLVHGVGIGLLATIIAVTPAAALMGSGGSSGSRGSRTFSAPPPTATAPKAAQPMQRTETPSVVPRPGMTPQAPAQQPRRFGFGTGLMAGLLGAGVFGMLLGHGIGGGLSGLTSMIGLLLQVALIAGLVFLVVRFFRRRQEPAFAGAPGQAHARMAAAPMMGGGAASAPPPAIGPQDYATFERLLADGQAAYSREDLGAIQRIATPEMVRHFAADIEESRRRNLRNEVRDVKLLQGDLSEAWREGPTEFATVAMRFSALDASLDRASGRVVEGSLERPREATEIWTFRRDPGRGWSISAIQQAA